MCHDGNFFKYILSFNIYPVKTNFNFLDFISHLGFYLKYRQWRKTKRLKLRKYHQKHSEIVYLIVSSDMCINL